MFKYQTVLQINPKVRILQGQKLKITTPYKVVMSYTSNLEKEMVTHSCILAWTEEPGRLQSMGLQRVGHD